jgi:hypothetical protein
MADPVVGITNGVPTSGTGTITTLGQVLTAIQSLAGSLFAKITDGTNTAAVKAASTAPLATDPALVTTLSPNSPGVIALGGTTKNLSLPVSLASDQGSISYPYPPGAVPITASATGTTAATTATLAGTAGKTTYLIGFSIRVNATAAATGNATVTGTITGTLNFTQWTAPLASGIGIVEPNIATAIPASGTNAAIAVVSAAPGAGGVVSVSAWGYQL